MCGITGSSERSSTGAGHPPTRSSRSDRSGDTHTNAIQSMIELIDSQEDTVLYSGSTRTHSPEGVPPIIETAWPSPHLSAATGASRSPGEGSRLSISASHAALAFQLPRDRAAAAFSHARSNTPSAAAAAAGFVSALALVRPALTFGSSNRLLAMYGGSPLPRWGDQWPASQPPPVWLMRS